MEKQCIICKKEFGCYDKSNAGHRGINSRPKRSSKSITCSRRCSKKYNGLHWTERKLLRGEQ